MVRYSEAVVEEQGAGGRSEGELGDGSAPVVASAPRSVRVSVPAESDYRTLDDARVRLAPTIDPRRQPTLLSMRAVGAPAPKPVFGVFAVAFVAVLLGGLVSWLLLEKYWTAVDIWGEWEEGEGLLASLDHLPEAGAPAPLGRAG